MEAVEAAPVEVAGEALDRRQNGWPERAGELGDGDVFFLCLDIREATSIQNRMPIADVVRRRGSP